MKSFSMKRLVLGLLAAATLSLASCDTTREINISDNGSGTISTTTDLSGLIGIAKMSGQDKEMEGLDKKIDTTINLASMVDSIQDLTPDEKALVKTGKLGFVMNMAEEKFLFKLDFPFKSTAQISDVDKISNKVLQQAGKKQMGGAAGGDDAENPLANAKDASPDDYFVTTYAPGLIEKKLNKDKYAGMADNEILNGMKEVAGMGLGKSTVVINLPKPAKKAEGAGVTLSADKKKVTITSSLEDFYDDAAKLEYHIEY